LSNDKSKAIFDINPEKYIEMLFYSLEAPFIKVKSVEDQTPYIMEKLFS
jgi:hypothetical protein